MSSPFRLIWNIVVRHWTVYRKDFVANTSPTITDPLFFMLALGMGLSPHLDQIDGKSYAYFLAPGLAASAAFFTSFFETSYGGYFRLNFEGVYKAMMTTPIGPREIILGEFLWVALKGFVMSAVVCLLFAPFGLIAWHSILFVSLVGAVVAVSCGAMGLIATTMVKNINQFQTVYAFLFSPMFFLSGILFPIVYERTPLLYMIVQISPLYHGTRLMQLLGWSEFSFQDFVQHLIGILLTTLPLFLLAYRKFKYRLLN